MTDDMSQNILRYLSLLMFNIIRVKKIKGRVKKEWKIPLRWAGRGGGTNGKSHFFFILFRVLLLVF